MYPTYSPPMYSPDGTKVAFGGDGNAGSGVFILDFESGVFELLTTDGGHGTLWSPDGTRIAYQFHNPSNSSNDVGVVGLDGQPDGASAPSKPGRSIGWADCRWDLDGGVRQPA